jgi:mannitol-1-phosphate/altronate dehydrogenase
MNSSTPPDRQALLRELEAISTMQRGTLAEEYREVPATEGKGTARLGPYFKHQCWEAGRNLSRRVPAHEVPALREDLANAQRFDRLTEQLAQATIEQTRQLRASQSEALQAHHIESKKNSRKLAQNKSSKKPSASLPQRGRASRAKG